MELPVLKTYKIYIDGKFVRSESGRTYAIRNKKGQLLANVCLSSRKDLKLAAVAARNAQAAWAARSAYNRSQILYRIAEMMEGRKAQFVDELKAQGVLLKAATAEVQKAIDAFVYYAGWCDKFQQVYSSVNPVASPHYNFSVPDPMGLVCGIAPNDSALAGLAAVVAPVICGGNTLVLLASEQYATSAGTFAEVLATSDLPAGVVNILTGQINEIGPHMSSHMDVNALVCCNVDKTTAQLLEQNCSFNLKRFYHWQHTWSSELWQGPEWIMQFQEIKTTWHPIENIGTSGSKY